ncbi:MAG: hypothetical protein IT323_12645 [Anaerolineae bacterium]|nr:hypothetical protein [Anaerolineae bacterium]
MKQRKHRMIAFKAYTDTDADLLAWWQSIPVGARSGAIRELLRLALGYQLETTVSDADMAALRADVAWIRGVLVELPRQVSAMAQPAPAPQVNGNETAVQEMDDRSAKLREQRLRKPKW